MRSSSPASSAARCSARIALLVQRTLARRRRVNKAPSDWDARDAMALLPTSQRGSVPIPELERNVLKALQAEPVAALGEIEKDA